MKTVPVTGSLQSVSFFEDDTIETVRQTVALTANAHPDRLFIEVKAMLPKEYYATNPKNWSDLFFRLSFDGLTIPSASLKTYIDQVRPGSGVAARDMTKDEWENVPDDLRPIFDPDTDFTEWRILGVEDIKSFVLPLPPQDLRELQAKSRPNPQVQSLFETLHPYEVSEIRATPVPDGASPSIKLNYYPRLRADTPPNIEPLRDSITTAHNRLEALLKLDTPKHETVSIVRAKWYIPLLSTRFSAPRNRFEQIFYGMTVNKTTPYIGYFTAKTETTRHKFFVTDPVEKTPLLDIPMWKSWTVNTQPQRRRPTLLLYRGTSRTSFDRIAVTDKDIVVDIRRGKGSKETLEEMARDAYEWMKTLDALTPFLAMTDIEIPRWELSDMSVVATYAKDITEFDMLRFPCLQTLFGFQNETFRLLRAEHSTDDISPRELQALQVLSQEDADRTPEYLATQMGIPLPDAQELFGQIAERLEDLNLEKTLKAYPTIKFSPKEVIIKFVTNLERTLHYVNILRYVLTAPDDSDSELELICPKRMETVAAKVAVPQQELQMEGQFVADDDFNALLGIEPEDEGAAPAPEDEEAPAAPKSRKVKVASRAVGTYNYFNNRLQTFDSATFDKSIYPSKCDKPKQAVVLTPADKLRMGPEYDFSGVPPNERLELTDPDGTVICPPYWCMRDEIPLREDQLATGGDGEQRCPVCGGKVRTADNLDTVEFPVIKRDAVAKYPDYIKQVSSINRRKIPCCFQTPMSTKEVLTLNEEATYVLDASTASVPPLRMAYLSPELADRLAIKTSYATTVKKGRIGAEEKDIFRIGLGRPSKTLPTLLNDKTAIARPRDAKDNLLQCSFFRTWKGRGAGDTEVDRIVASIDHAYQHDDLPFLEELEYVTSFLKCEVIRVDTESGQVVCGFWSESVGASSRTIALLDTTLLAQVHRVKDKKAYRSEYTADLRKPMFAETLPLLKERHARACAVNAPMLSDAIAELQAKGKAEYQVILDPFKRIQAVFVPTEVILPIHPSNTQPDRGVPVRNGYADIRDDELPTVASATAFLSDTKHAMFAVRRPMTSVEGPVVELELASGFRVPVQAEAGAAAPPTEVTKTVRMKGESMLVDAGPNLADRKLAEDISYASEIYEFLLFTLSKDVQTDDYDRLRTAIQTKSDSLQTELETWFKAEAYEDTTKREVEFVNKVRTPCGQFSEDFVKKTTTGTPKKEDLEDLEHACNKSSLCGWKVDKGKGVCKVRVKPLVEKGAVLRRLAKVLRENDKQRALVLDGRMSPFFSTLLYLEMPHELITTTI